jgi:hypothetical protein
LLIADDTCTGRSLGECKQEVDLSIQRLFYWGAYADKYGGTVQVRESSQQLKNMWHGMYVYGALN